MKSKSLSWVENGLLKNELPKKLFPVEISREARKFHRQIPGYSISPLRSLSNLAQMFGVGGIWAKDEAVRLELNSFKVLGGSFAIYQYVKGKLGIEDSKMSYEYLISKEVKDKLGTVVFASATDGNHGRGIAWAAQKLGHKSEIYVHAETSQRRIDAIKGYGANVTIVNGNYDDAVKKCWSDAEKNGWEVVSDTSWEGYEAIPTWIMQGYTTMVSEIQEQFSAQGIIKPTHIFVQAGVGALACAVVGFYNSLFPDDPPISVIVEPDNAACLYHSAVIGDGKPHTVGGSLSTIMAGLACGEPSPLAWKLLKDCVSFFISCPDYISAKGMRIYATPLKGDPFVVSGESGAVTLGALTTILKDKNLESLKKKIGLNENSQILLINTEGNTDPVLFRQVIWEGANPVPSDHWTE